MGFYIDLDETRSLKHVYFLSSQWNIGLFVMKRVNIDPLLQQNLLMAWDESLMSQWETFRPEQFSHRTGAVVVLSHGNKVGIFLKEHRNN